MSFLPDSGLDAGNDAPIGESRLPSRSAETLSPRILLPLHGDQHGSIEGGCRDQTTGILALDLTSRPNRALRKRTV
jgi:hypothetical protein